MQQESIDLIEQLVTAWKLPSLSFGLVHYGESQLQSIHADNDTAYPIASVTKTFTAYTVLRAQQQGLLHWDDPICQHLPQFALQDEQAAQEMTIRDLLCHRSGLPPHSWAWVYSGCSRNEFIATRLPHLASLGSFREQHAYSNIGYAILGAVIEAVSGKTWESYLSDEVLLPLGMTQTQHLSPHWHQAENMAQPFAMERGDSVTIPPFHAEENHPIAPASELSSSGQDLMKWLTHHISPNKIEELFKPLISINSQGLHYGMGWRIEGDQVWHTGSCSGYSSIVAMRPEKQDGLFFLSNCHGITTELRALSKGLFSLWDGVKPPPIDFKPSAYAAPKTRKALCEFLSGSFQSPGYGTLVIDQGLVSMNGYPLGQIHTNARNTPELHFQDYNVSLPIEITQGGEWLAIPFESQTDAISFAKKA